MDTTHCISNGTWEAYAQKTFSAPQLHALQKHVEGCEMCADIKEGIDSLAAPETLPQTIAQINTEVDDRLKPKRNRLAILWYSSAAAAIVLAVGIGWYFMPSQQENVAQNVPVSSHTPEIIANDTAQQTTPPTTKPVDVMQTPHEPQTTNKREITNPENHAERATKKSDATDDEVKALEQGTTATTKSEEEMKATEAESADDFTADVTQKKESQTLRMQTKKEVYPSNMSLNNNLFFNNTFSNNTGVFLMHDSVSYTQAMKHYNAKQYDSCVQLLQNRFYGTLLQYNELSALLQAQALIKLNRHAEAQSLLHSFVFTDEHRKKEALQLLKSIEDKK